LACINKLFLTVAILATGQKMEKKRIFIVDDNEELARVIQKM